MKKELGPAVAVLVTALIVSIVSYLSWGYQAPVDEDEVIEYADEIMTFSYPADAWIEVASSGAVQFNDGTDGRLSPLAPHIRVGDVSEVTISAENLFKEDGITEFEIQESVILGGVEYEVVDYIEPFDGANSRTYIATIDDRLVQFWLGSMDLNESYSGIEARFELAETVLSSLELM